jgi:hypothetical protein
MRRLAVLFVFLVAAFAAPSLFAQCYDCPDGVNCWNATSGWADCYMTIDSGCVVTGSCGLASAPALAAEYRVAAVRVIAPKNEQMARTRPSARPLIAEKH